MDRIPPPSAVGPESVYMVEAYRAAGSLIDTLRDLPDQGLYHPTVLAVIDVPGDEVALYVISATDAATAERLVRNGGMRAIRVVPVQWDASTGAAPLIGVMHKDLEDRT